LGSEHAYFYQQTGYCALHGQSPPVSTIGKPDSWRNNSGNLCEIAAEV